MLMLLLLGPACSPPPGGDSPDSAVDTSDSQETSSVPGIVPPPWESEAAVFTLPEGRGRTGFVLDETFSMASFAVPQLFVAPDGRFGMMVTDMRGTDTFVSRSVVYSDDGVDWDDASVLIEPRAWPSGCGARLEDGAVWHRGEGVWLYIVVGTDAVEVGSQGKRVFCQATTTDGVNFETAADPLYTGSYDGDLISVPAILPVEDGDGHLYFNGDLLTDPGIRIATVDVTTLAVDVLTPAPILPATAVDPNPVYLAEGGLGLFHTWADPADPDFTGLAWARLDEDGVAIDGADDAVLRSPGVCGKERLGACYVDPTYATLPDGRLALYFGEWTTAEDGSYSVAVRRAFSVD